MGRQWIFFVIFLLCCSLLIPHASSTPSSEQSSDQSSESDTEPVNLPRQVKPTDFSSLRKPKPKDIRFHDYELDPIKKHPILPPMSDLIVTNDGNNPTSFFNPTGELSRSEYFPDYLEKDQLPLFEYIKDLRSSDVHYQNNANTVDELFPSPPMITNDAEEEAFNAAVIVLPENPQGHRYLMSRRSFRPVKPEHRPAAAHPTYSIIGLCYADLFPEHILFKNPEFLNKHVDISQIPNYQKQRAAWFGYKNHKDMPWIPRKPQYPMNIAGNSTAVTWRMHCTTPWTIDMNQLEPDIEYLQSIKRLYYLGQEDSRSFTDSCGQILATCGSVNDVGEYPLMAMRTVNIDEITRGSLPIQTLPACNPKETSAPPQYDPQNPHDPTTLIDDQYYMHRHRERTHLEIEKNWLVLPYQYGKSLNFNYTQLILNTLLLSSSSPIPSSLSPLPGIDNDDNDGYDSDDSNQEERIKEQFLSSYDVKTNTISLTQAQFNAFNIDYAASNNPMLFTNSSSLAVLRHTTPFLLSHGDNDIYEVPVQDDEFANEKNVYPEFTGLLYCLNQHKRLDVIQSEIHSATNIILLQVPHDDNDADYNNNGGGDGVPKSLPRYVYMHVIHYIRNKMYSFGRIREYNPLIVFFDALTLQQIGFYDLHYGDNQFDRFCPSDITDVECSQRRLNHDLRYTHSIWFNQAPLSLNVKENENFKKIIMPMYNQLSDQFFVSVNIDDLITYHQEINLQYVWRNLNRCVFDQDDFQQTFVEGLSKQSHESELTLRDLLRSRLRDKEKRIKKKEDRDTKLGDETKTLLERRRKKLQGRVSGR